MSEITYTFAGDESGDSSFSFAKGASRYFVIAMISTNTPEVLRALVPELRKKLKFPEKYEFKFHKLTGRVVGKTVFTELSKERFKIWAIMVTKTALPDSFRFMSGLDFYLYFVSEIIRQIPDEDQNGALLILDEFGSKAKMASNARRVLKARNIQSHFRRIVGRDSETESLIQIADLIAGSISHRDTIKGNDFFDQIKDKIVTLIEYPA